MEKKTLYITFLGHLTKKGNLTVAQKILKELLLKISKVTNIQIHFILSKIFIALNIFVETKKVKIRKGNHIIPFAISFNRKMYLILKWIIESASENTRKISMSDKLFFEVLNILKNKSSNSKNKRSLNINQALHNRSNIHFRW